MIELTGLMIAKLPLQALIEIIVIQGCTFCLGWIMHKWKIEREQGAAAKQQKGNN